MALFPNLDNLRNSLFPGTPSSGFGGISDVLKSGNFATVSKWIQDKAFSRPRDDALSSRHKFNQGGMLVSENGDVSLRAGHKVNDNTVGASVVLHQDGSIVITAPGGIVFTGGPHTYNNSPSEAFSFQCGKLTLNPHLETHKIVVLVEGNSNASVSSSTDPFDNLWVGSNSSNYTDIRLSDVIKARSLYKEKSQSSASQVAAETET